MGLFFCCQSRICFVLCLLAFHNVMKKGKHVFEGYNMTIRPYIPELGVLPPGHDFSMPPKPIPASITWKGMDQRVLEFLLKSEENRNFIENDLRQIEGIVRWPQTSSEPPQLDVVCSKTIPISANRT